MATDEVVREIEVYHNPSIDLNTKLYVLQFLHPYELAETCEEVEIDLTIDLDSKNDDRNNADPDVKMIKKSLKTPWKPTPFQTGYAVGVLVGNELHLNPLHAFVRLRENKLDGPKKTNIQGSTPENPVQIEEEVKERKPNKALGKLQDKDTKESWVRLKYHGARSDVSSRYLKKMVEVEGSPIQFNMTLNDYLDAASTGRYSN